MHIYNIIWNAVVSILVICFFIAWLHCRKETERLREDNSELSAANRFLKTLLDEKREIIDELMAETLEQRYHNEMDRLNKSPLNPGGYATKMPVYKNKAKNKRTKG